jgi:hypothetical protein
MSLEEFDYGGDDNTSAPETKSLNELDDLLGTSGTEDRRPRKHKSLLAELNMRVMLQVAVAVVLLSVAGVMLVRDVWARQTRDTAFRRMIDANGRREYLRAIEAAEKFLTQMPLNGSRDVREENVVSLYSEALVHWVAQQSGKLDPSALARVARYQQLVKSHDK